jgi:hypothetical protein
MKLAHEAEEQDQMATYVRRERSKVNFDYWRLRAKMEQTPDALAARSAVYSADQAYAKGDIPAALEAYERGLKGWRAIMDRFPTLKEDVSTGGDLVDVINRYRKCLRQDDRPMPKPFILQDILDRHEKK